MKINSKQVEFWNNDPNLIHYRLPLLLPDEYRHLYENKDILEIGPGKSNRGINLINNIKINSYSIADIGQSILSFRFSKDIKHKLLITDYSKDFNVRFDLIQVWYVIHHIEKKDVVNFLNFIKRHLKKNGILIINYPFDKDHHNNRFVSNEDDINIKTTKFPDKYILSKVSKDFNILYHKLDKTGYDILIIGKYDK